MPYIEEDLLAGAIVVQADDPDLATGLRMEATQEAAHNMTDEICVTMDNWSIDLFASPNKDVAANEALLTGPLYEYAYTQSGWAQDLNSSTSKERGHSVDDKYKLYLDGSDGASRESNESDLDVHSVLINDTYYRVRADVEGNIWFATYVDNNGGDSIYDVEGHTLPTYSHPSESDITSKLNSNDAILIPVGSDIMAITSNPYAVELEVHTKLFTNLLSVITRGGGDDEHSFWTSGNEWYYEAIDGICYVNYERAIYYGFEHTTVRSSILNPSIIPESANKGDILTLASSAAFAAKTKSEIRASEPDGFICNGFGLSGFAIGISETYNLYYSKAFSIPNANVQDLS